MTNKQKSPKIMVDLRALVCNYCQCELTMRSIILPFVSYVNCYLKSYPQSYPHNSSTIIIVYGVIHRLIHSCGARFSLPRQRKLVSDTAKSVLWKTVAIFKNAMKESMQKTTITLGAMKRLPNTTRFLCGLKG